MSNENLTKVDTIYDRDENACYVVQHPDPESRETFAIYNSSTGLFKADMTGKPKRFKKKDTAGHLALVDSAMFKEVPNTSRLRYSHYRPKSPES